MSDSRSRLTTPRHECHPLLGQAIEVVDAKDRVSMQCIGRTGVIHHDDVFDQDYLSFDDGGSADPFTEVIVEPLEDRIRDWSRQVRANTEAMKAGDRKPEHDNPQCRCVCSDGIPCASPATNGVFCDYCTSIHAESPRGAPTTETEGE